MRGLLCTLLALLALGCARTPPAPVVPAARYVVGEPYALGGVWSYPRESFALSETGVAEVVAEGRPGRRTANGEVWDDGALVAAHRTLQLPAILVVTNLENGRTMRVRVNDRGPARPGRILGLSRRAAALLGVAGAARVAVAVDGEGSRALARSLPGEQPVAAVATAPRVAVDVEGLAPLPGARVTGGIAVARAAAVEPVPAEAPAPPLRLPEVVEQRAPTAGRLVLEAGVFFRRDLAARQAARLGGVGARVEPIGPGRQPQFRVVGGPFDELAAADRAVAGALAAGLPEVRLLVE